jgi:flagellar basal-body rod modification protein FlgD
MTLSPISSLSSLPEVAASSSAPTKALGKDEFLRLLTTQLQHQDPLSPMDSHAFVAQLAQFASVEELDGLGRRLDTMLTGQAASNQMGTAALVGKEILFRADRVSVAAGQPGRFEVTLPEAAAETVAILADSTGRVVRTLPLGARGAGTSAVSWDGLDEAGNPLPAGDYVVTVAATRADGTRVDAAAAVRGTIAAVTFENGVPELLVQGRHVLLSDVVEIGTPRAGA